jgi:hypothetical protein
MSTLTVGLLYIAPFLGGILGSAITGRLSDIITRFMTRRNAGIFEPEFRLVMVTPVALATTFGLWGFGWASWAEDEWIAPCVFFGVLGFGCTLGSTVSISFVVDSYRSDAGSSLTSLNLSKNVLGKRPLVWGGLIVGFAFSLFTNRMVSVLDVRTTFLIFGGIQLFVCSFAIPLYIYGKRCRAWTHRKGMMDWLYD